MTILCATCGVETAAPLPETCRICADERQWVPLHGQIWTSVEEQLADGMHIDVVELELLPGVRLIRFGGHFPGAAVIVWERGSGGQGSLLAGDTMQPKQAIARSAQRHIEWVTGVHDDLG
ncbi:hypothetical protein [Agrococcus sp. Marseille-Q4369]|uniref:hypothetical protein n=1 Tax=Agrococcus sp. Marseille-Q4369 TaxID=2810513 RepID=UPI001B8CC72D|nr:hypothetical protein [Agrococcus sp. Marseille-Q4369]QUW19941.1 hypothetical protein JSQ78_06615 [Agrococcus sp. Marseille-Q4369]